MSDINKEVIDNLVKNIVDAIDSKNNNNSDIIAPVIGHKGNKITVSIQGATYNIKNGIGINFNIGDKCLIHCINGNFQNKIIIAKL